MKKVRGSLTLEAVIAFTVFTSFMFMLLVVVKMSVVIMTLDSVTAQTAKSIASSAYPLGMFNDVAEANDKEGGGIVAYEGITKLSGSITKKGVGGLFDYFLASDASEKQGAAIDTYLGIAGSVINSGISAIADKIYDKAQELIETKSNEFVLGNIREGLADYNVGIKEDNLELTVCKLPVPLDTYKKGYFSEAYKSMGLTKDDFNEDDVVIGLTYDYKIALPFLPEISIKLKSVAIEHAWVNGENCESISLKEGINVVNIFGAKVVYVGTGVTAKKYHKQNCRSLWREGKTAAITYKEAKSRGLEKCKICKPIDIYKNDYEQMFSKEEEEKKK